MKKTGRYRLSAGRGFTLIEILVVISIIAVLVAIALMVFGKSARINARKTAFKADVASAVRTFTLQCDDGPPIVPANTPNTIWNRATASGSPIPGTRCGPLSDNEFSIIAYPESQAVIDAGCSSATASSTGADFRTCP